jgi:C-terminal processing protease CtpA/Prc
MDIRTADRPGLIGWIVDLRGNGGGNMWPMIAGVGPVLGEGIIGWIVYNNREYEREYRDGGALSLNEAFAQVANPYTLLKPLPRVAVLTDGLVNSAGEAIAVYFKGRPETRSFGTPTCGHHHLLQGFVLSDRSTLSLTTAQHADRTKRLYGGPIAPDETIGNPEQVVERAIAWLRDGR